MHGEAFGEGQDHYPVGPMVEGAKENLKTLGRGEGCLEGKVLYRGGIRRWRMGLAISLLAGEAASLLLSRRMVPTLYYLSERRKYEKKSGE